MTNTNTANFSLGALLSREKYLIIDGSMSTALEHLGCNLNDRLWTARVLADHPELVKEVHLQYLRAGADLHISASYQATIQGLTENGYSLAEAEEVIRRSVRMFKEARAEWWEAEGRAAGRHWPLVGGAIGLACGGGMYVLSIASTFLVLVGLEAFNFFLHKFDKKRKTQ